MTTITATSAGLNAVSVGFDVPALDDFPLDVMPAIEMALQSAGDWRPVQLSSTRIAVSDGRFTLALDGRNLAPVSDAAGFAQAVEAGRASGSFVRLSLSDRATELLSIGFGPAGYTVTSGDVVLTLAGRLPDTFAEFYELGRLVTALAEDPAPAERAALIDELGAFDLSGITLTEGGETLFGMSFSGDAAVLSVGGYTLSLEGALPDDFGGLAVSLLEVSALYERLPPFAPVEEDDISSFRIDRARLVAPDGTEIGTATGELSGALLTALRDPDLAGQHFAFGAEYVIDGTAFDRVVLDLAADARNDAVLATGTDLPEWLGGLAGDDMLTARAEGSVVDGGAGNDRLIAEVAGTRLQGHTGSDTLIGSAGADDLQGGATPDDLRDVSYGGAGNDMIDGGYGNDDLHGGAGADTIAGGFGADTVIGNGGDDVITGGAFSDLLFGGDGMDFVNGGFGSDRVNGGAGADRFFHAGSEGHGSDWIRDFFHAEGDTLVWGGGAAREDQFQVNIATTPGAGDAHVEEAFVIHRPTGQILWALVDGAGEDGLMLQIGGASYDLLV
ncbi:calcium-binding protein [Roseivivax isoporae]|uniref:Calcium-binding protein n=1 Tax=Roseivivax isoporae LMG 25204 TaxID=1449351 RepID=X7F1P1_9RHOB|nr:calcium-binding protein [Roseivivax isoporae]ETX26663.1 hypothetical protein RISW2_20845 [Roseivivax isoporae LMG 25204]